MPPFRSRFALGALALASLPVSGALAQTTVTFTPVRDGTIYETWDIFNYSNGAGEHLFVGRTNQDMGSRRRGLVAFNLGAIPAGATITSATLRLHMSRTGAGAQTISLRKATSPWGEGISDAESNEGAGIDPEPNDVTWVHSFFPGTFWNTPGGDFSTIQSASKSVSGVANYTWGSSAGMIADVQAWVNNPATNFGWALVNNSEAAGHTAKRFDTRENATPSFRPLLTVIYTPPPQCPADWDHNGVVNSTDVSNFINDWFTDQANGTLITDWDHNGVVNSTDVSNFINDWFASPPACLG
jgi:hypothetical protein